MQFILSLIVHNLPSLTVRNNLWLCDTGTSPCASLKLSTHATRAVHPVGYVPDGLAKHINRCLDPIPRSLSTTAARCLPDFLRFSWPLVIFAHDGCDIWWYTFISRWLTRYQDNQVWLLTTDSMAYECAIVTRSALMQFILSLIVHNLPSLTVRNKLWLCDTGTSPCASLKLSTHATRAVHPVGYVPDGLAKHINRCLDPIPRSLSTTAARCLPDFLRFSWPLVIFAHDGCDIWWYTFISRWLTRYQDNQVWLLTTDSMAH